MFLVMLRVLAVGRKDFDVGGCGLCLAVGSWCPVTQLSKYFMTFFNHLCLQPAFQLKAHFSETEYF